MSLLPARSLTSLLLFAAVGLFAFMWYYTDQLNQGAFVPDTTPPSNDLQVLEVDGSRIILAPFPDAGSDLWKRDGHYGLAWAGGYGRVGRIIDVHPDRVVREFTPLADVPPLHTEARLDTFYYRGDPTRALGLDHEEVSIETPAGRGPAWLVRGESDTWAVFVHGKGSSREEAFRVVPVLQELGLNSLLVSYRNDVEFVQDGDGRYGYGETEWQDIAAAMDYGLSQGADRFVLLGNSMGGAIVMALLLQPEYAPHVAAAVLDAPVLSLKRTVEFRAGDRGIPGVVTSAALQFATWRSGIDWAATDYLARSGEIVTPLLLFHGDEDRTVPVSTSDAFAEARPDIVTYRRLRGVGHVQGWNADRESYTLQLREFLRRTLAP